MKQLIRRWLDIPDNPPVPSRAHLDEIEHLRLFAKCLATVNKEWALEIKRLRVIVAENEKQGA